MPATAKPDRQLEDALGDALQRQAAAVRLAAEAVEAARLALVRRWDRLAWQYAEKRWVMTCRRGDVHDYHAAAVAGLWQAATKFDPARGFGFSTYAGWYMRMWVGKLVHHEAAGGLRVPCHLGPVQVPVGAFGEFGPALGLDDGVPYEQSVPAPEGDWADAPDPGEVWAAVDAALADDRERMVVWLRYRCGFTLDRIGASLGVSKERVRQIIGKAIDRLRGSDAVARFVGEAA